jgi:hypothetical protein
MSSQARKVYEQEEDEYSLGSTLVAWSQTRKN